MERSKLNLVSDYDFNEKIKFLVDNIINGKDIVVEDLSEVLMSIKFVILNYSFLDVCNSVKDIVDKVLEMDLDLALKEDFCLSIIDSLKGRKRKLSKDNKKERSLISRVIKSLEIHLLIYDTSFIVDEQKYDYAVMDYCINNEVPYCVLKRIILAKPELVYLNYGENSIIFSILENYIESQKKELRGFKKYYINKEYYRNFYFLLLESTKGVFSKDIQELFWNKVEEFRSYLKNSGYKQDKKNEALFLFDEMINGKRLYVSNSLDLDVEAIAGNLKELTLYLVDSSNRTVLDSKYFESKRVIIDEYQEHFFEKYGFYSSESLLCQELGISKSLYDNIIYGCSSVSFLDKTVSYSLLQDEEGCSYLRMNVFDLSSYIKEGDLLDKYLLENISNKLRNCVRYRKDKSVVSLTYQVKIFPNGKIGGVKIFPSVVRISEEYSSLDNYKQDETLKRYVGIYKKMTGLDRVNSVKEMECYFKLFIENKVLKMCINKGIPIILKGRQYIGDNLLMSIKGDLSTVLSKMTKEQMNLYLDVLNDNYGDISYANSGFDGGCYGFKLNSASSYVDLFNQRLLFLYDRLLTGDGILDTFKNKSDDVVKEANYRIGYVEESLGKLKKKRKKS